MNDKKTPKSPEKASTPDLITLSSYFLEQQTNTVLKNDLVNKLFVYTHELLQ